MKLLKICVEICIFATLNALAEVLDYANLTDLDASAEETQHTYCKIATEQLQATANATIVRELKGVCTSKEFKRATSAILKEIQTLKDALIIQVAASTTAQAHHHTSQQYGGGGGDRSMRNKRRHFANVIMQNSDSFYWTIIDANQNLHDDTALSSPQIVRRQRTYHLSMRIMNRMVSISLENESRDGADQTGDAYGDDIFYQICILNHSRPKRDLCLTDVDQLPLRRLRKYVNAQTNVLLIKILMF